MAKKKKFDYQDFHFCEVSRMVVKLNDESDRAVALIVTAWLDDILVEMIKRKLVADKKIVEEVFRHDAALGTFSSRISLAYLVRCFSKEVYSNLHIMRTIRNDFAHDRNDLDFTNESVRARCEALYLKEFKDQGMKPTTSENINPRNAFIATGIGILGFFIEYISTATMSEDGEDYFPHFMKHMENNMMSMVASFKRSDIKNFES